MNTLKGRTLLLTGASGFIGTAVMDRIRREGGVKLVALSGKAGVIGAHRTINRRLEHLSEGTWEEEGIERLDVVVHLAAFTPKNPVDADHAASIVESNVVGTQRLLESLPRSTERFVFGSTLDVYDPEDQDPVLTEKSRLGAQTAYSVSKLLGEMLVKAYCAKHQIACVILRYGHIYGPGEQDYEKFIPLAIGHVLRGRQPVLFGQGETLRDYLYVRDAAEATFRATVATLPSRVETINIVRGEAISTLALLEKIFMLCGLNPGIRFEPSTRGRSICFDNGKMKAILGSWDFQPIEDGLRTEIAAMRNASNKSETAK